MAEEAIALKALFRMNIIVVWLKSCFSLSLSLSLSLARCSFASFEAGDGRQLHRLISHGQHFSTQGYHLEAEIIEFQY